MRLRCKDCKGDWAKFGSSYERLGTKKVDYYCTNCASKKKPEEYSEATEYKAPAVVDTSGNLLIIGDTHIPFEKKGYLDFVSRIQEKYNCETVYHVGDIVDNHAISFHDTDPNGLSGEDEAAKAQKILDKWYARFPEMSVCIGNHGALPQRRAYSQGIPDRFVKTIMDVYNAPEGWNYEYDYWVNDSIKITHGTGFSGKYPHANAAASNMCNVIMGHTHSVAGVHTIATERDLIWGMAVGCGIERHSYAFKYARDMARKPVISCGVVLGGETPIIEYMPL